MTSYLKPPAKTKRARSAKKPKSDTLRLVLPRDDVATIADALRDAFILRPARARYMTLRAELLELAGR